jgi:hypothetical protein
MKRVKSLFLAALVALPVAAWAGDGEGGQSPPPATKTPTKDAEAAEYMKTLAPTISKQADADAKTAIKKLVEIWKDKDVSDATKKGVPDLLEKYARGDSVSVAIESVQHMAELSPAAGAPPTVSVLERTLKAKTPEKELYRACFATLKKLADTKGSTVKTLADALKFRSDDVIARAADAMAGYKEAPGKVRKEMLEELIKLTEGVFQGAQGGKNSTLTDRWNVIKASAMGAMNALSGQTFKDPSEARGWFNDHKDDKSWKN